MEFAIHIVLVKLNIEHFLLCGYCVIYVYLCGYNYDTYILVCKKIRKNLEFKTPFPHLPPPTHIINMHSNTTQTFLLNCRLLPSPAPVARSVTRSRRPPAPVARSRRPHSSPAPVARSRRPPLSPVPLARPSPPPVARSRRRSVACSRRLLLSPAQIVYSVIYSRRLLPLPTLMTLINHHNIL